MYHDNDGVFGDVFYDDISALLWGCVSGLNGLF